MGMMKLRGLERPGSERGDTVPTRATYPTHPPHHHASTSAGISLSIHHHRYPTQITIEISNQAHSPQPAVTDRSTTKVTQGPSRVRLDINNPATVPSNSQIVTLCPPGVLDPPVRRMRVQKRAQSKATPQKQAPRGDRGLGEWRGRDGGRWFPEWRVLADEAHSICQVGSDDE